MVQSRPILSKLRASKIGDFFRPSQAASIGISAFDIHRLVQAGAIERINRGLYRIADADPSQHYTMAAVCARAPSAILCLLSALSYHKIGTVLPRQVWIAIPQKARAPRLGDFPVRIVRFSGAPARYGIQNVTLEGVPARVTNPARTVVDCFRLHRHIDRAVALEALREAIRERKTNVDAIWRCAEVCGAKQLIAPHLEALSV